MSQELASGTVFGRYTLLSRIGSGSSGTVFRGRAGDAGKDVALKVMRVPLEEPDEPQGRLRREASILSRLSHPRIARFHEVHVHEGRACLVMEYVPGRSLAELFRSGSLLPRDLLRIACQVLDGLESAWESQRVIHRDVKPSNIRVTPAGEVKLVDFGLARTAGPGASATTLTAAGAILGTPHYMAPEQASRAILDFRSDLYSLGVILYEGLTGSPPFCGGSPLEVILRHREEMPVAPDRLADEVPPVVSDTILAMLEKDPGDRFQSFGEVREAFRRCEAALGGSGPGTTRTLRRSLGVLGATLPTSTRFRLESRRRRARPGAVALAMVLGVLVGAMGSEGLRGRSNAGERIAGGRGPDRVAPGGAPGCEKPGHRLDGPCPSDCENETMNAFVPDDPVDLHSCPHRLPPPPPELHPLGDFLGGSAASRVEFDRIFYAAARAMGAKPEDPRALREVALLERELAGRVLAFDLLEQGVTFSPRGRRVLGQLRNACVIVITELRKDHQQATRWFMGLEAVVQLLPHHERDLLRHVLTTGKPPPFVSGRPVTGCDDRGEATGKIAYLPTPYRDSPEEIGFSEPGLHRVRLAPPSPGGYRFR